MIAQIINYSLIILSSSAFPILSLPFMTSPSVSPVILAVCLACLFSLYGTLTVHFPVHVHGSHDHLLVYICCLVVMPLVFFHRPDIMFSSIQTQLYIIWIIFLTFILLFSPLPWLLGKEIVKRTTGLVVDGPNCVHTLEPKCPSLTGTEKKLENVCGLQHLTHI